MILNEFVTAQIIKTNNEKAKNQDGLQRAVDEIISEFKANNRRERKNRR